MPGAFNYADPVSSLAEIEGEGETASGYRADDIMNPEKGVSTGTTIMAVEFNGGVVMAADSRTSMGSYVANRVSRKITKVHDRIYVCRSGSAADTQALTNFVQHYLQMHAVTLKDPTLPKINTCASLFQTFCYNYRQQLMAGLIIGGWDKELGGQVYEIPLGGAKFRSKFAVGGSGSAYIMGLIDNDFKEGMSEEECLKFCRKWVSHAMARDGSSGGVIRTMVIKKEGCFEGFTPGDKLPFGPL